MKLKTLLPLLCGLCIYSSLLAANDEWLTRSTLNVIATTTIQTVVPAELHRLSDPETDQLDLALVGPDGNSRAFELFWRETSDVGAMLLKPNRVELLDDRRLLWEAEIPENYLVNTVRVNLPALPPAARLTFEGVTGEDIETLGMNVAVLKSSPIAPTGQAMVKFAEKSFEKIRIYFAGFDENFNQTPIQAVLVLCEGRRGGNNFYTAQQNLQFEEVARDDDLEVRVRMPGTGIMVESLEITTEASFQGTWKLGSEKIVLGQSEFSPWKNGEIRGVSDNPLSFKVPLEMPWKDSTLILQLNSQNYFGRVLSVKARFRLPYLVFAADMTGDYQLLTGRKQLQKILPTPAADKAAASLEMTFSAAEFNSRQQAEILLKDFAVAGGPFKEAGYSWQAPIKIEKPGFYQLQLGARVALDGQLAGLRIVRNGQQIPYFHGRSREYENTLNFSQDFDAEKNQSVYSFKIPAGNNLPLYLKVKSSGIFERQIILQKHEAGKVGWQNWKTQTWKNNENSVTEITLSLRGFPADQKDLRLVINNGSNQAIPIAAISAWYRTSSLFFVALEPGEYSLYGGNTSAGAAKYDLAIIQNRLMSLFPEQISHGQVINIAGEEVAAGQEKGGPFSASGYTWVASISAVLPGLTQVVFNQQAALDEYRAAIRITRDGHQIPYFAGDPYNRSIALKAEENYDRDKNKSTIDLKLPVASKFWQAIEFNVPGVFNRQVEVQLRKPGKLGWKKWKVLSWIGTDVQSNLFRFDLGQLPKGETELRLEIAHGDNSPVVFTGVSAIYQTRDLFFDATAAGTYQLYGGNSSAKPPTYDIALIRNSMLKSEPNKIQMGETAAHSQTEITRQLEEVFSERGYGLYLVLGLVTLVLLVLIVKMLPEEAIVEEKAEETAEEKAGERESAAKDTETDESTSEDKQEK